MTMPGPLSSVAQLNELLSSSSIRCFVVDREGHFAHDVDSLAGADRDGPVASIFDLYGSQPHASIELERLLAGNEVAFTIEHQQVNCEIRAKPLRDERGGLIGAVGVVERITEAVELQRQLVQRDARLRHVMETNAVEQSKRDAEERRRRDAEAQLRHAVDHCPFILWSVDEQGVFTLAEGQGLAAIGRKPGQAVGQSALELYEDLPEVMLAVRRGLAGEAFTYVSSVRGRIFETRTFPVRDAAGRAAGFSAVSLDVTERQQAEMERARRHAQQLEAQRLESLGLLAGGIAHDFNNILTAILGSTVNASLAIDTEHPAREDLDNVVVAARRAADLTHQMLAYSGRAQFEVRELDLSSHVHEIATLLTMTVSKKVQLCLEAAADLPAIMADTAQIQQVVMNLVLNAAEAIGDRSGTVVVTTGVHRIAAGCVETWFSGQEVGPGEYVFLEVRDTGTGIDPVMQGRIFDPFFTTKFTGRGLGLSTVLGVVRSINGAIKVESRPGHGSSFKAIFPSRGRCAVRHDPGPSAQYRGEGVVLVIDDDDAVRRTVRDMLARLGFSVLEASNGSDGVKLFRDQVASIRAVLLDMTMPEMSGDETCLRIHECGDVPVILISGYTEPDATQRFPPKAFAGFLHKPFTRVELSEALRRVLEKTPSQSVNA
jgi:two-component system, cell cycle sensor histidine kinase and response regulator CckA